MRGLNFEVQTVNAQDAEIKKNIKRKINLFSEIANNPDLPDKENRR